MRKRRNTLATLRRLLDGRESQARQELARRRERVQAEEAKRAQLAGLETEYQERFRLAGESGMDIEKLRLWRRFSASLGEAVKSQGDQVAQLEFQQDAARQAWMVAQRKSSGGEKLEEMARREAELLARRKERQVEPRGRKDDDPT